MAGLLMAVMFLAFFVFLVLGYVYNAFLRFKQKEANEFFSITIQVVGVVGFMIFTILSVKNGWMTIIHKFEFKFFAIMALIGLFEMISVWSGIIGFVRGINTTKFHKYLVAVLGVLLIIVIIL